MNEFLGITHNIETLRHLTLNFNFVSISEHKHVSMLIMDLTTVNGNCFEFSTVTYQK